MKLAEKFKQKLNTRKNLNIRKKKPIQNEKSFTYQQLRNRHSFGQQVSRTANAVIWQSTATKNLTTL